MDLRRFWRRAPARDPRPVFVRGMSRSGGTLMVTLLDAHPAIAMSYELYPVVLVGPTASKNFAAENPGPLELADLERLPWRRARKPLKMLEEHGFHAFRTFAARAWRSGVEPQTLLDCMRDHWRDGDDLASLSGRLRYIERVGLEKMRRQHKSRWGAKCSSDFETYLELWPDARFLNMVRDGRDVLASQKTTGSFQPQPAALGQSWASLHRRFHELVERPNVHAMEVIYEDLAHRPEETVERICTFLDVPFEREMLDFNKRDLTIYQRPQGHLSISRITQPIDASKIGRWREDLAETEAAAFVEAARPEMERLGYLEA